MTDIVIFRIVAFCILMENKEGILGKSPGYIREKFNYCKNESITGVWGRLDDANQAKFREWIDRWIEEPQNDMKDNFSSEIEEEKILKREREGAKIN